MRRREFLGVLGGAAAAYPVAVRAQRPAIPAIGFLSSGSAELTYLTAAFRRGLSESGYVEGQNLAIEYRWAEGVYDRLPARATDLVRRQVAAIFASAPPAVLAARRQPRRSRSSSQSATILSNLVLCPASTDQVAMSRG